MFAREPLIISTHTQKQPAHFRMSMLLMVMVICAEGCPVHNISIRMWCMDGADVRNTERNRSILHKQCKIYMICFCDESDVTGEPNIYTWPHKIEDSTSGAHLTLTILCMLSDMIGCLHLPAAICPSVIVWIRITNSRKLELKYILWSSTKLINVNGEWNWFGTNQASYYVWYESWRRDALDAFNRKTSSYV